MLPCRWRGQRRESRSAGGGLAGQGHPQPVARFTAGPTGAGPTGLALAAAGASGAASGRPAGAGPAMPGPPVPGCQCWAAGRPSAGPVPVRRLPRGLAGSGAGQPPFPASHGTQPARRRPARAGTLPPGDQTPDGSRSAGTAAWGAGTIGTRPSAGSPAGPAFPRRGRPAGGADPAKGAQPGTSGALPPTARPGAAKPRTAKHEAGKPEAGRSEADSTRPKTGVPPWEITDSFLAVPPAEASGPAGQRRGAAASTAGLTGRAARAPGAAARRTAPRVSPPWAPGGPAVLPPVNPGDSTESFPAMRPRADLEDAFRCSRPCGEPTTGRPRDGQD